MFVGIKWNCRPNIDKGERCFKGRGRMWYPHVLFRSKYFPLHGNVPFLLKWVIKFVPVPDTTNLSWHFIGDICFGGSLAQKNLIKKWLFIMYMSADTIGGNLRDQFQQFTKNIRNGPNNNKDVQKWDWKILENPPL